VGAYFRHRQHTRPVDEVVAEIRSQKRSTLFFVDDNLIADHAAAKALFRALIPLRVRWVSQASLDQVRDPELMELMVQSGGLGNVIGFESLDPDNLSQMHKSPNLYEFDRYASAVQTLSRHHLQTWAAFLLGYDHDTPEVDPGSVRVGYRATLHLRGLERPDALSGHDPVPAAARRGPAAVRRALVAAPGLPRQ
jgi:radical SAM superfamily enzyme YgiQ (UPF0313 family)